MLRKLLTAKVRCVEVVSAIGAVSEGASTVFPVPLFLTDAAVPSFHSDILMAMLRLSLLWQLTCGMVHLMLAKLVKDWQKIKKINRLGEIFKIIC